jgi:hypothetical protein
MASRIRRSTKPLVSHEVIVNLIAATTTRTGLRVRSELDTGKYPKGIKVGKQEFASIQLLPGTFHGEWNYVINLSCLDRVAHRLQRGLRRLVGGNHRTRHYPAD